MFNNETILQLYENVLYNDKFFYNIPDNAIKSAIEVMQVVYKPSTCSLNSSRSNVADYNNPSHRCAYLHKYAAFHTAMVRDMMHAAIQYNFGFFYNTVFSSYKFNVCCLGGGPGTDVIGVLAALHDAFSYFETSATIVDYMVNWKVSFESILRELGVGYYGAFGNNTYHFLEWRYLGANLLKTLSPDVGYAIASATLVTMIKFTSAASCIDTENMINNIFTAMKPGAILFFIDNDAGGYHQLIMRAANVHQFISIYGPIRHENYINHAVKVKKFGYTSCFKTIITVHVLQKPPQYNFRSSSFGNSISSDRYVTESPAVNFNPPNFHTSLTPYVFQPTSDLRNIDFTKDPLVPYSNNNFSTSSIEEVTQSPRFVQFSPCIATSISSNIINSPYVGLENLFTPDAHTRSRKNKRHGCFPIKQWRNKVCKKMNHIKAQTSSLLKRRPKVKKNHPVFRL